LSGDSDLIGRPALAEELMVLRDIELVRLTGCALHFMHLSTARSVALVLAARAEGLPVTCEVAPHHFTLDESVLRHLRPLFKVHPPLRAASDVEALRARSSRVVDAVATDHAPHAPELKDLPFDEAPAGMLGLEHAASLTFEALGAEGADPSDVLLGLSRGSGAHRPVTRQRRRARDTARTAGRRDAGEDANIVVFDPGRAGAWVARVAAESLDQHALRRTSDARPRRATLARATRRRRGGADVTRPARSGALADGTTFEGYAAGYLPESGSRRGVRLQHRALGLPRGHHRPELRRTDHQPSPTPTSATTASRARRRGAATVVSRRGDARTQSDRPSNWRSVGRSRSSCAPRGPGHRRDRHATTDPAPARHGALPGAFGHGDDDRRSPRRRAAALGTDGSDLVTRVSTPRNLRARRRATLHVVAFDYGIKTTMVHQLASAFA
jgi:hypothetical protein